MANSLGKRRWRLLLVNRGGTTTRGIIKISIGGIQKIMHIGSNSTNKTSTTPLAFCGGSPRQAKPYTMYGIARQIDPLAGAAIKTLQTQCIN